MWNKKRIAPKSISDAGRVKSGSCGTDNRLGFIEENNFVGIGRDK